MGSRIVTRRLARFEDAVPESRAGDGAALREINPRSRSPLRASAPLAATKAKRLPRPVFFLLVSLFVPWVMMAGQLALTPYRIVLLVTIIPALLAWASGKAGRIRIADVTLLLFCAWSFISLILNHGLQAAIQSGGVQFVETIGGYMVARVYIRGMDDFYNMAKVLFGLIVLILPFALFESLTGRDLAMELFRSILPAHPVTMNEPRLGLRRAQTVFEHPILFGVVCSSAFALTHLVLGRGKSVLRRWSMGAAIALSVLLSLSSGPISGLAAQVLLLAWGWSLSAIKIRWKILIGLVALGVLLVEVFAKRSLPQILFSSFALDVQSAYFRLLIWEFGSQSALNHPWFGVGFGGWDRPFWLGYSIDMFWLCNAVVFGIPAGALMLLTFFSAILPISIKPGLDDKLYAYRTAYLITMTGLFLVGWTVHFWNATYVLFLFLLGSGMWILECAPDGNIGPLRGGAHRRTDGIAHRAGRGHRPGLSSTLAGRRAARGGQGRDEASTESGATDEHEPDFERHP